MGWVSAGLTVAWSLWVFNMSSCLVLRMPVLSYDSFPSLGVFRLLLKKQNKTKQTQRENPEESSRLFPSFEFSRLKQKSQVACRNSIFPCSIGHR